jgi:hypothetical protein
MRVPSVADRGVKTHRAGVGFTAERAGPGWPSASREHSENTLSQKQTMELSMKGKIKNDATITATPFGA